MQETVQKQSNLKMSGIDKHFAGVQALKNVSLELFPGEILALIGENGAGKSTLMRILMGIEKKDAGTIHLNGTQIDPATPIEAEQYGIGMVFQEQALFPNLSVAENLFLGREGNMITGNFLHWKKMYQESEMILNEVHLSHIDPKTRLEKLSFSERQMVELARVLYPAVRNKRKGIIILDEPTAVLSPSEVEQLFKVVSSLKEHASFVFISHHLEEVIEYTDRVEVMKDGQNVGGLMTKDASIQTLQEMMVGREFSRDFYYAEDLRTPEDTVVLELDGVCSDAVSNVSLKLRKGEILGIAGLMGCGKENLAKVIFGDEPVTAGTIIQIARS
ncbi:MAG: sugar ABC transporter ATP-binding protein, partial [Ruminococcus sp.]|nr:sugar ABC transporter ATP-binding protein [Ruminococcus sp.]